MESLNDLQQIPILFVCGVLLFLLVVAFNYLLFRPKARRSADEYDPTDYLPIQREGSASR